MKAMTFEEIWSRCNKEPGAIKDLVKEVTDLARIGMVPEDECVRLPKVEEWPEWAEYVDLAYVGKMGAGGREVMSIQKIPRPTLEWRPSVGEAVFWFNTDTIHTVEAVFGDNASVIGVCHSFPIKQLKPARSLDQLGKPWEEIPNA